MKKKTKIIISAAVVCVLALAFYVVFFMGIVSSHFENNNDYRSAVKIHGVNYAISKNNKVLHAICNDSYMICQDSQWADEDVDNALEYYSEYYEKNEITDDNMFYREYLTLLGLKGNIAEYKAVCEKFLLNAEEKNVLIADSLKNVYQKGNEQDKEWVKDTVNKIISDERLFSFSSEEQYESALKYYETVFEETK